MVICNPTTKNEHEKCEQCAHCGHFEQGGENHEKEISDAAPLFFASPLRNFTCWSDVQAALKILLKNHGNGIACSRAHQKAYFQQHLQNGLNLFLCCFGSFLVFGITASRACRTCAWMSQHWSSCGLDLHLNL